MNLISTFVDYKICPDLIQEDNLISPFFTFFEDSSLFDFDSTATTKKLQQLFDNFSPDKIICEKMSTHTLLFARLVHNLRFFLIIFELPDS